MQLQTDHITEQDGKIERLNNQVDEYCQDTLPRPCFCMHV